MVIKKCHSKDLEQALKFRRCPQISVVQTEPVICQIRVKYGGQDSSVIKVRNRGNLYPPYFTAMIKLFHEILHKIS